MAGLDTFLSRLVGFIREALPFITFSLSPVVRMSLLFLLEIS
jgi:hypothetical protein